MQEKLVIFLHAHAPENPDWVVINEHDECTQPASRGEPAELARLAASREVVVIVPAESILLTNVSLPKMNRSRLLAALPYALEEQLIDDVDNLHFACGDYQANGELPVAVVAQEKIQQWLNLLDGWAIKPDAMVPLILAVPLEDNVLHVVVDQVANTRLGTYAGFACDVANLQSCYNLTVTDSGNVPTRVVIHNITGHSCADELKITATIDEEQITPQAMLMLLAKTINHKPYLNILQGGYQQAASRLPTFSKWLKVASVLMASWLLLFALYPLVSYVILSSRLHAVDSKMRTIYHRYFPTASTMVAPKIRLQEKLQGMEGDIGQHRLLLLLGYVGKAIKSANNVKLTEASYQNGQLSLVVSAASSDDFSAFTELLSADGLSVKQQNASLSGARVNATLLVE